MVTVFCEIDTRREVWSFQIKSRLGVFDCCFYPDRSFAPGLAALLEMSGLPLHLPHSNDTDQMGSSSELIQNILQHKFKRISKQFTQDVFDDLTHEIYAEAWVLLNGKKFFILGPNPNMQYLKGSGPKKDLVGFLTNCCDAYRLWLDSDSHKAKPHKAITKQAMADYWRGEETKKDGMSVTPEAIKQRLNLYHLKLADVVEFCRSSHACF